MNRLLAMKDMKAMLIALAWLLPVSTILGIFIWSADIKASSLEIVSLEGAVYFIALFTITATVWLLAPGFLFVLCLIADGICVVRSKLKSMWTFNRTVR